MARTPKAVSAPIPARRGRKPKASATALESAGASGGQALDVEAAEAGAVTDAVIKQPSEGRRGRTPKQRTTAAISSVFESDAGPQPAANMDPLEAAVGPAPDENDALIAEMAYPVSAGEGSGAPSSDTGRDSDAAPSPGLDPVVPQKPAAQWDRATDTVRFDWPEIESTASHAGPNQAMAKLLVAARAEGANSRWPL